MSNDNPTPEDEIKAYLRKIRKMGCVSHWQPNEMGEAINSGKILYRSGRQVLFWHPANLVPQNVFPDCEGLKVIIDGTYRPPNGRLRREIRLGRLWGNPLRLTPTDDGLFVPQSWAHLSQAESPEYFFDEEASE
jgi:hypothetical protein